MAPSPVLRQQDLDHLAALLDEKLKRREAEVCAMVKTVLADTQVVGAKHGVRLAGLEHQTTTLVRGETCPQSPRLERLETRQRILWWATFAAGGLGGVGAGLGVHSLVVALAAKLVGP